MIPAGRDLPELAAAVLGPRVRLEPLAGDASDRRYVRAYPASGAPRILMVHAHPFDLPYLPWERMAAFLAEQGFPVPAIVSSHPREGVLVLEDVGDRSLQAHLLGPPAPGSAERERLYAEAVDWIVRLQRRGTPAVTPSIPAYHFALDETKLGRELGYFAEHYVRRLLGDPLAADAAAAVTLRSALASIAAAAGRPGDRVLCHRDYHSRNLMLREGAAAAGRLVILDFQDARLGPRAYDLASLLEDAYVDVPEDLRRAMTARYLQGIGGSSRASGFAADYAVVATQRTLKAVGTFAGQATRFGVTRYLDYIPRALDRARAALARLPEHAPLLRLLEGPLAAPAGR